MAEKSKIRADTIWEVLEMIDEIGYRENLRNLNIRNFRDWVLEKGLKKAKEQLLKVDDLTFSEEDSD